MKKLLYFVLMSFILASCGEEVLTQNTLSTSFTADNVQGQELNTCSQMHFEKPPVDILFIVDNSGSSLLPSFNQIKAQIANTINTISNEFDYHIYVTPLIANPGESLSGYQLLVSDISTLNNTALNVVTPENLQVFADATGGQNEAGFQRALDLINANRTNGIFRNKANTVVVTISNGDDTTVLKPSTTGNPYFDPVKFSQFKQSFLNYKNGSMNAESFRYISLVAHSACNGFKFGYAYKRMSNEIYSEMGYTDDSGQNSHDLCSGNYASLFSSINNSIHAVVVGHKYDHWKISSASAANIQSDDITVTKILDGGSQVNIPVGSVNGFEYIGHKTNQNTRYEPTAGEPATGLMIKLNGTARVSYPECLIAKTRTPTEYFGYLALPREPQSGSIKVVIRGQEISQDSTNGWGYIGWVEGQNIKVPGPDPANPVAVTPEVRKTGYFIKLFGNAVFTNGDTIQVFYKPASL